MHTIVVTLIGFVLLIVFIGVAFRRGPAARTVAAWRFIGVWLVACIIHLCVGVFVAGYSLASELAVHAVVFGLPAILAWFLARQSKLT
ncbi:MAG: hypothetical protein KIT73_03705 [Burkholderiales bacterium]|nr:hypothetical protein [Burkholderiales bacterium]